MTPPKKGVFHNENKLHRPCQQKYHMQCISQITQSQHPKVTTSFQFTKKRTMKRQCFGVEVNKATFVQGAHPKARMESCLHNKQVCSRILSAATPSVHMTRQAQSRRVQEEHSTEDLGGCHWESSCKIANHNTPTS